MLRLRSCSLTVIMVVVLLPACAAQPGGVRSPAPSGGVLTAEQMQRTGAQNAWEILVRSGIQPHVLDDRAGASAVSARGERTSRPGGALLVVDGMPVQDLGVLREMPVEVLERIRVLDHLSDTPAAAAYTATNPGLVIEITTIRRGNRIRR